MEKHYYYFEDERGKRVRIAKGSKIELCKIHTYIPGITIGSELPGGEQINYTKKEEVEFGVLISRDSSIFDSLEGDEGFYMIKPTIYEAFIDREHKGLEVSKSIKNIIFWKYKGEQTYYIKDREDLEFRIYENISSDKIKNYIIAFREFKINEDAYTKIDMNDICIQSKFIEKPVTKNTFDSLKKEFLELLS